MRIGDCDRGPGREDSRDKDEGPTRSRWVPSSSATGEEELPSDVLVG